MIQWGETWGIYTGDQQTSKLESYLSSGTQIGPHVAIALLSISGTFADLKKLRDEYGVELDQKESVRIFSIV